MAADLRVPQVRQAALDSRGTALGGCGPRGRLSAARSPTAEGADAAMTESAPGPTGSGPLAGLLVADFSRILAGPYAAMLLADLGAEVVKVESPAGDDTRTWSPPVRDGRSTYYLGVNRNKRSVALDLKDDDELKLAQGLAGRADILLENF